MGRRNGGYSHLITHCLCCSFFTLFHASPWRRLQVTVLNEILHFESFPWAVVPQEWTAPVWVLHRVTGPSRSLFQPEVLSRGPDCFSTASLWTHCLLQAHSPAVLWGLLWAAWRCVPPWTSRVCRTSCLTMVFTLGCRITSAPAAGAAPAPPSSLTLGFADSHFNANCCFEAILPPS